MTAFSLVTGNPNKLAEYRRLLPADFKFEAVSLELEEIQSLDTQAILEHKVRQAYALVGSPVIVEDLSAGLDKLKGLPGPFIKFFEQTLGRGALYQLAGEPAAASITCSIAYFDGKKLLIANGTIHGTVHAPRGERGFGFDSCFVLDGEQRTFAEMSDDEKDTVSHRALAVKSLLAQLKHL